MSGGRPPIDNIIIKIIMDVKGSLFHEYDREVIVVVRFVIKSVKIVIVIRIYMYKFNSVIVGLYVRMATIQPM